jgi:hypothetical protein
MPKRTLKRDANPKPELPPTPSDTKQSEDLDEAAIAKLAYLRWVQRGCPQGSAEDDWFEARKALRSNGATMRTHG